MKFEEYTTQDYFSSYLQAAVKNTKIKYIKKQMRFQAQEISMEIALGEEEKSEEGYEHYLEKQIGYLGDNLCNLSKLFELIESERLIKALKKLDRQRLKLFFVAGN